MYLVTISSGPKFFEHTCLWLQRRQTVRALASSSCCCRPSPSTKDRCPSRPQPCSTSCLRSAASSSKPSPRHHNCNPLTNDCTRSCLCWSTSWLTQVDQLPQLSHGRSFSFKFSKDKIVWGRAFSAYNFWFASKKRILHTLVDKSQLLRRLWG